ncbi:MAG: hypothetical protein JWP94_3407, partial [Mucilaginibacter sp.]|nr:hypothetical protein [Mucilaginibacter sp.]
MLSLTVLGQELVVCPSICPSNYSSNAFSNCTR